jgi:hypothetical protein
MVTPVDAAPAALAAGRVDSTQIRPPHIAEAVSTQLGFGPRPTTEATLRSPQAADPTMLPEGDGNSTAPSSGAQCSLVNAEPWRRSLRRRIVASGSTQRRARLPESAEYT